MSVCVLQNQSTPLHKAAKNNKFSCIKILQDNGASLDAKNTVSYCNDVIRMYVRCVY